MKFEDLSFNMTNKDGLEVICDITSVIPNEENSEEPYVVFTDYMMDSDENFIYQYGRLVKVDDEYVLKVIDDGNVINYIKEMQKDEIVDYVNTQVQDNLSE